MFSFSRRKVTNKLTALFNHGNVPTVLEVLLNEDLLVSVKNEVPELVEWIFVTPPRGKSTKGHLDELLEWALEGKSDPQIDDPGRQINLRAGKIFSGVTKEIHKRAIEDGRLTEKLDNFPNSSYARKSPQAGIWASIYAAINRHANRMKVEPGQDTWLQIRLKRGLIETIMKNIDFLPYRSLLGSLITDATGVLAAEYDKSLGKFIADKLLMPFVDGSGKDEKGFWNRLVFTLSILEALIIEQSDGVEILQDFSVLEHLVKICFLFEGKRQLGMYKVCHLLSILLKDRKRNSEEKKQLNAYWEAHEKEINGYEIESKALIFPIFSRHMIMSVTDYFFSADKNRGGFENNSSFSQAYIHAFERLNEEDRQRVIRKTHLIDRICAELDGNKFSPNFFIVRLAEIIANGSSEIKGWDPMMTNLISAMETLREEIRKAHADDVPM